MNLTPIFGADGFKSSDHIKSDNKIPPEQSFLQTLRDHDFLVDYVDASGEIVRHATKEKPNSKEAWSIYFSGPNISSGAFGNWRTGEKHSWCSGDVEGLSPIQRAEHREQVEKQKAKAEAERKREQDRSAEEARKIIVSLSRPYTHVYLEKKHVKPHGIYVDKEDDSLVIPMQNIKGEMRSFQRIYKDGSKYFFKGGQTKGCFLKIGSEFTDPTYIVEGYATGATVYEVVQKTVIVAFNSGNLGNVVHAIQGAGHKEKLVICADNDRGADD